MGKILSIKIFNFAFFFQNSLLWQSRLSSRLNEHYENIKEEEKNKMLEIEFLLSKKVINKLEENVLLEKIQGRIEEIVSFMIEKDINVTENFRAFLLEQARSPRWEDYLVPAVWLLDFLRIHIPFILSDREEFASLLVSMLYSQVKRVKLIAIQAISECIDKDYAMDKQIHHQFQEAFSVALNVFFSFFFFTLN